MEALQSILLIIHIILAILIVVLVLLQPSTGGDGLVSTYSGGGNFMSARATANLLSRSTMILAVLFMLNTLFIGIVANKLSEAKNSIVDDILENNSESNATVPLAE